MTMSISASNTLMDNFKKYIPSLIPALSSKHFPFPSLVDTPIPEQQLQHQVTHSYAKPNELQRLTVSTYHRIHPT